MSTLEKTICLLNTLAENQIENKNSYVEFLTAKQKKMFREKSLLIILLKI